MEYAPETWQIVLGSAFIPAVSGRSGQSGPGLYQFPVAELFGSPEREAGAETDSYFRAAVLAALDSNTGTEAVIEIPPAAHVVANEQPGVTPAPLFGYANYNDFSTPWQTWLDAVETEAGGSLTLTLPASDTDAQALATTASNRIKAGSWALDHNAQVSYATAFPGNTEYQKMALQLSLLVMPDGLTRAIGVVGGTTAPATTDVATLAGDEYLSERLFLDSAGGDWNIVGVLESGTNLLASGRIIGNTGYDGLEVDDGETTRVDYEQDYPSRTAAADLDAADVNRIEGTVFNTVLSSVGMRLGRAGIVAPNIHQSVLDQLPDFYQMTFKMGCFQDTPSPSCTTIPESEQSLNFPQFATQEKPRIWQAGDEGKMNVQILDNGLIITDRDRDCTAVDGSLVDQNGAGQQEYQIGFISRTETSTPSVNITLMMAAGVAGQEDPTNGNQVPHFGTTISGRLDLSQTAMPIYRLSDDNFGAEIRALWVDIFQPNRLLKVNDPPDTEQQREITAQGNGAVSGVALDTDLDAMTGSCSPVI